MDKRKDVNELLSEYELSTTTEERKKELLHQIVKTANLATSNHDISDFDELSNTLISKMKDAGIGTDEVKQHLEDARKLLLSFEEEETFLQQKGTFVKSLTNKIKELESAQQRNTKSCKTRDLSDLEDLYNTYISKVQSIENKAAFRTIAKNVDKIKEEYPLICNLLLKIENDNEFCKQKEKMKKNFLSLINKVDLLQQGIESAQQIISATANKRDLYDLDAVYNIWINKVLSCQQLSRQQAKKFADGIKTTYAKTRKDLLALGTADFIREKEIIFAQAREGISNIDSYQSDEDYDETDLDEQIRTDAAKLRAEAEAAAKKAEQERIERERIEKAISSIKESFDAKKYEETYNLIVQNNLTLHQECINILKSCKREQAIPSVKDSFKSKQYEKAYNLILHNDLINHPECVDILQSCKKELEPMFISKAKEKMAKNDRDEALVCIDFVLKVNPNNIEAAKIKRKLIIRKSLITTVWTVIAIGVLIVCGYFLYNYATNSKNFSGTKSIETTKAIQEGSQETGKEETLSDAEVRKTVEKLYKDAFADNFDFEKYCTQSFISMYNKADESDEGNYGYFTYNIWVQSNDSYNPSAKIESIVMHDEYNATVSVNLYMNGDYHTQVKLIMKKQRNAWKVADMIEKDNDGSHSLINKLEEYIKERDHLSRISEQNSNGTRYVQIDGTNLRLRLGPSTDSEILTDYEGNNVYLDKGTRLEYLGEENDFYKVRYNSNTVYISKQFSFMVY